MKSNNILTRFVLKEGKSDDGKVIWFVNMTDLDFYGYNPEENLDGRFCFIINNVNFYQSDEYSNAFSDDTTQSIIFTPDDNECNVELHIINDYE